MQPTVVEGSGEHRGMIGQIISALVAVALLASGCTPWDERERAPTPVPIDTPETLADLTLPDFAIQKVTAQQRGYDWVFTVWVQNNGGNQGLLGEPHPVDGSPRIAASMRINVNILQCLGSRDQGDEGFECVDPREKSRRPGIGVPLAGESRKRMFTMEHLYNPWQIWVMAAPTRDDEPVVERDSPARINNQALLKIVYDPERSSYDPLTRTWTWPNDEDTLPF